MDCTYIGQGTYVSILSDVGFNDIAIHIEAVMPIYYLLLCYNVYVTKMYLHMYICMCLFCVMALPFLWGEKTMLFSTHYIHTYACNVWLDTFLWQSHMRSCDKINRIFFSINKCDVCRALDVFLHVQVQKFYRLR
jgi:hypothetical protein